MDAVLDGEATPSEVRELDRLLAIDSAARTEFAQLKKVFEALREVPQAFPPEGLVAAVLANIPQNPVSHGTRDQLSSRSRVIGSARKLEARGKSPGESVKGPPVHQPAPFLREWNMNESNGSSRRRNVWVGSGIAIAAALVALAYTIDFPPGTQNAVGTIVPAQRFKAAQPAIDDVKAGGQSGSRSVPLQAGSAANAATNNAVVSGTTNAVTNGTTNAVDNASTNAVVNGTTNAINAGTTNAINAGTTNAVNNASMNAVNAGATNAVNAGTTNAVNNASMNAVSNASTNAVANGTTNAVNNSATNAVSNGVTNATNNAVANGVTNATNNAINASSNNAVKQ
jgi:anti-sigma factor RsiW